MVFSEKEIKLAHEQGAAAGQISIVEFTLKSYGHTLDPRLKMLLEKVAQDAYEVISRIHDVPAEDVALEVQGIVENVVDVTK